MSGRRRLAVAETLGPDDTLFVVDFFGGQEFVRAACARAKAVVILDHHKTAAEELAAMDAAAPRPANLEVVMDMERSGATIARDYFGLGDRLSPEQTKLFALIEDNDLWRQVTTCSPPPTPISNPRPSRNLAFLGCVGAPRAAGGEPHQPVGTSLSSI